MLGQREDAPKGSDGRRLAIDGPAQTSLFGSNEMALMPQPEVRVIMFASKLLGQTVSSPARSKNGGPRNLVASSRSEVQWDLSASEVSNLL